MCPLGGGTGTRSESPALAVAVGTASRRHHFPESPTMEVRPVKLSPEEREQFKRELPISIILFIALAVLIAFLLAVIPPVAVRS